ncbi:site-2 protease family protein [Alsobacter sp. SYSU M60028]|uniref:Zinc metalloprotease n=1 Tax=Alsobacter ponti TaxID=2962936 RepID=A0ABT1LCC9_9HYPH|nr:site-2 protease family protein [Alsobacter ponti]MCP8938601.1 site-2 protease family protein [Alsobacter ponti]
MPWSFTVGTIAGTAVRIHMTFLLFLVWIGVAQAIAGGPAAAWGAVAFISLLFFCVVLHEFGHILAARRYGIRTPEVTLYPIGGVASLERLPEKPAQELVVALAGPAVNLVIAAVLIVVLGATLDQADLARLEEPGGNLLARLAGANLFLAAFNLIPAFPMDGGRVLRAVLAMRMGPARATHLAARIGQVFAVFLAFVGFLGNPILVFIGIFVYMAAGSEDESVSFREATRDATAADAMVTSFASLPVGATVRDAVDALLSTSQEEFPVVDGWGRPVGLLTRGLVIAALGQTGEATPVADVMADPGESARLGDNLHDALEKLRRSGRPAIGVVDADGRVAGMLSNANVMEMMMVRAARPDYRFRRRPA